jgi:hypothetical protein
MIVMWKLPLGVARVMEVIQNYDHSKPSSAYYNEALRMALQGEEAWAQ